MSDLVSKRLNLAARSVEAATLLIDALYDLKELKVEYSAIGSSFQDADFASTALKHLDAFTADAVLSIVTPSLDAAVLDVANGNFNQNVLMKVRR